MSVSEAAAEALGGCVWRRSAWAVLVVTVVHDLEELLTVKAALSRPPMATLLHRRRISPARAWSAFRALNWAVSSGDGHHGARS